MQGDLGRQRRAHRHVGRVTQHQMRHPLQRNEQSRVGDVAGVQRNRGVTRGHPGVSVAPRPGQRNRVALHRVYLRIGPDVCHGKGQRAGSRTEIDHQRLLDALQRC